MEYIDSGEIADSGKVTNSDMDTSPTSRATGNMLSTSMSSEILLRSDIWLASVPETDW